jgi:hypothetical protein
MGYDPVQIRKSHSHPPHREERGRRVSKDVPGGANEAASWNILRDAKPPLRPQDEVVGLGAVPGRGFALRSLDLVLLLRFRSGRLRAERHQSGEEKCITQILVFRNRMRK